MTAVREDFRRDGLAANFLADEIYLSPLVHVFKRDTTIALFHSLRLRKIYGNSFLERLVTKVQHNPNYQEVVDSFGTNEKKRVTISIDHLIERGFITTSKHDNLAEVLRTDQKPISPTTLRLLITNGCNFSCTYCQIERNLPKRDNTKMDKETVDKSLDLLQRCSPPEIEKTIILTGGEPLLNLNILQYVVERSREKIDNYRVVLFTNGSLITSEIAEYFKQNNILVLVSLDGHQTANDKARMYLSQRGTFDEVIRGYGFCKSAGCDVGISAVLGKHNVSEVPDIVNYFINLGVRSIGLNFPHHLLNIENPELIPMDEYTTHIINAFKRCREAGVFLENSSRPLGAFVENKLRLRECSALGKGITVNPYGVVGTCKTLITAGVINRDIKSVENVNSDTTFLEWAGRSTLSLEECTDCSARGICGTGCAYDSYCLYRDIKRVDPRTCTFSTRFLEFMIWDLFDIVKDKLAGRDYYEPSIEEQRKMYGIVHERNKLLKSAGHQTGE